MSEKMDRRRFLLESVASAPAFATRIPAGHSVESSASLHKTAKALGIDIGTAYNGSPDGKLVGIIRDHCSLITPETALKPRAVAPRKGVFDFARVRAIYEFSLINDKKFHGHTLYWHGSPIEWAQSSDFGEV